MSVHLRCPEDGCGDLCESVEELATHLVADHEYDRHAATPAAKRVAQAMGRETEEPMADPKPRKKPRACGKCGKPGHRAPECTSPPGIVGQARKPPPTPRVAATNGHDARGLALEKVREELIDARAMVLALERLEARLVAV
jgi:hypothetical protein